MEIYVNHIHRKKLPSYVFPEGYIKSQHPSIISQLVVDKAPREGGEDSGLGLSERRQKRRDLSGLEVKEERLEKRQSISFQMQSSVSPELFCSSSGYTLKDCSSILSEMKKERDAVNGSCLLNIGMTAVGNKERKDGVHGSCQLNVELTPNGTNGMVLISGAAVGSEPVQKAVTSRLVCLQLPEKVDPTMEIPRYFNLEERENKQLQVEGCSLVA
ncbi:unnamed protein product [Fraxinus pennsylvanica]|uniref:Uncharacterized protein n=1 Tax=Fraxinus pennsylvanica TaxID=56036 RepID=A0AAD1YUR6_9LAMI|nr:unnamed protein product [Fraxinus pennsylvanica]